MTLLDDVIDGASGTAPVAQLLRQVKVLASRTGTSQLEAWVDHELGGYPDDIDVPSYRGPFTVRPLGHFVGPAGMAVENVEIPPSTFPAEMRDSQLFKRIFAGPIAGIEQMAGEKHTSFGWSADVIRAYHRMLQTGSATPVVADHLVLAQVRYTVPATTFAEIVDAVRNKVLDLALALERVAPLAGARDIPPDQEAPAAAVINNHFHGSSNVAIGGVGTQVIVEVPTADDRSALLRYLGAAGMAAEQLVDLERALDADEEADGDSPPGDKSQRWTRTRAWLTRAASDATSSAVGGAIVIAAEGFLG